MAFRRELAADTLVAVAAALQANWAGVPRPSQERIKREIDEQGHAIYRATRANRASKMLVLLDEIAALPGLPAPVADALAKGAGQSQTTLVLIADEQRDRVLEALRRVHDVRAYDDVYNLAEHGAIVVRLARGQLDPATWAKWEALDEEYRLLRRINATTYLNRIDALLGDRLPAVREALDAGKSWAAETQLGIAGPPTGGIKGLGDTGGGPVQIAPPAPAPAGEDRGLGEAAERVAAAGPVSVPRSANVYFPAAVQLAQKMVPLIVHVAREEEAGTVTVKQGSSKLEVSVGDLKIFVLTADFTIERAIGGTAIEDVDHGRIVRVDPAKECEPVIFFLSPTSAGEKRISIEFKQFGKRVGSLAFDVSVLEDAVPATRLVNVVDNQVSPFSIVAAGVTAGQSVGRPDLDLRVLRQGRTLIYSLTSADGKYDDRKLGQKELEADPEPYFADIAMQLSDLAAKRPEYRTEDDKNLPSQLGAQLWDLLLSKEFRAVYRDDLRVSYKGKSLKITTDEPWVPWEMLRPVELGAGGGFAVDDPPLCETFVLTRWLDGRGASDQVQLKRGVIVAPPEETLPSIVEELTYFAALPWVSRARTKEEASLALRDGAGELFHFSCHGGMDPGDAWLKLGEEYLKAKSVLYGREFNVAAAFIFLNACEAGQAKLTITGLDGWALAFLRRHASVFIGSLWSINDRLAAQFARTFYDCLLGRNGQEPQPVGVAFQAARQAIKAADPYNPTWLAYVLYGDPNGRVFVNA